MSGGFCCRLVKSAFPSPLFFVGMGVGGGDNFDDIHIAEVLTVRDYARKEILHDWDKSNQ